MSKAGNHSKGHGGTRKPLEKRNTKLTINIISGNGMRARVKKPVHPPIKTITNHQRQIQPLRLDTFAHGVSARLQTAAGACVLTHACHRFHAHRRDRKMSRREGEHESKHVGLLHDHLTRRGEQMTETEERTQRSTEQHRQ
jgi:hypothetical protein